MTLIDITRPVQEAPIYPGSPPVVIERIFDMTRGDVYNASIITAGSHMGTHADAYTHFLAESTVSIDRMELKHYYGLCQVLTVPENTLLTPEHLIAVADTKRLVIHGGGYSYLTEDAARYMAEKGIFTLVTDAWSVAPLDNEVAVHRILLGAGVAVVENVILDHVVDDPYTLSAFPIKFVGCDGAPVRAVLIRQDD